MELKSAIESRRSIRRFKPDPVPEVYIKALLEAARLAPSGGNIQPWRFVILKSPEARARLSEFTLSFVAAAPVVIACCTDMDAGRLKAQAASYKELRSAGAFAGVNMTMPQSISEQSRPRSEEQTQGYLHHNTAIAVEHIILRAADLGLGSCWVMMFNRKELAQWLQLPENIHPFCLVPIGYPDQHPPARPRRDLSELIIKEI